MTRPYYARNDGLRFACTRCGNCCTRPGPVLFPKNELADAAAAAGLSVRRFRRTYDIVDEDGIPTHDPPGDAPCGLYDPRVGCTIYEGRPTQCRTWPFWPEVVKRRRSWEKASEECPGMDRGPRHAPAEIERTLVACQEAGLPEGDPW
jgi:Fe-S-cluster containining protein